MSILPRRDEGNIPPPGWSLKTLSKPTCKDVRKHYKFGYKALGALRPHIYHTIMAYHEDIKLNIASKLNNPPDTCAIIIVIDNKILGLGITLLSDVSHELYLSYAHELAHIFLDASEREAFILNWEIAREACERNGQLLEVGLDEYLERSKSLSPIYDRVWEERPSERGYFYMDILKRPMDIEDYRLLCQEKGKPCPLDMPPMFNIVQGSPEEIGGIWCKAKDE